MQGLEPGDRIGLGAERQALATIPCNARRTAPVQGWEGHDWDRWLGVTTWRKPDLRTDQADRRDLVPVLGDGSARAPRITTVRAWEQRRKQTASAIQRIFGEPSNLKRPALEVREWGVEELEGYSRRRVTIRSEADGSGPIGRSHDGPRSVIPSEARDLRIIENVRDPSTSFSG